MQLLLQIGVFLGHLLVLGFPLAVGDFECLNLSLVVAGLDVGLAESILSISHKSFADPKHSMNHDILLVGLAQVLVCLFSLLLK